MALQDFLSDLNGSFEGAGMGMQMLGGMQTAKIGAASNPWVQGGLILGGAGLGLLNGMDPSVQRARRLNERLGNQEAEMGDINIKSAELEQGQKEKMIRAQQMFGNLFSNYMSGFASAKPNGQAAFQHDVGVI